MPIRHTPLNEDLSPVLLLDSLLALALLTTGMHGEQEQGRLDKNPHRSFSLNFSPRPSQSEHGARVVATRPGASYGAYEYQKVSFMAGSHT